MVLEKIKVILAEQFDVEEDSLKNDTDLQDDLGADSLDVVDLLMSIEDEFEIEIPDEEVPLAAAPKTGDISALWMALSGLSASGFFFLGRKRKDEEA